MEKNFLKKIIIVLIAGLGVITYSCSEEDIFEDNFNIRSLAKRNIQSRIESIDPRAVDPISGSFCTGSTISGKCTVRVEWTHGYITGNDTQSTLSPTVESCRDVNARDFSISCCWIGYYGITGSVSYTYDKMERIDSAGTSILKLIPTQRSDQFNFSPNVSIISKERLDDLLGN